jgi:hypothetical protein
VRGASATKKSERGDALIQFKRWVGDEKGTYSLHYFGCGAYVPKASRVHSHKIKKSASIIVDIDNNPSKQNVAATCELSNVSNRQQPCFVASFRTRKWHWLLVFWMAVHFAEAAMVQIGAHSVGKMFSQNSGFDRILDFLGLE